VNSDLGWRFPALDDSEREGINDSITKAFAGNHEHFIARECIQNSIDHRHDKTKPVKVEFRLKNYSRSTIPGIDELEGVIDCCLQENASERDKEGLAAIKKAASASHIKTLVVRDFNTEGLNGGDYDEAGSWHRLVRAIGSNDPSGVGGGSYGLGKGAPFAASGMRTVFYSTYNEAGETVFQGKTRLVSHKDKAGDQKRGVGFYGIRTPDKCASVRERSKIQPEFLRTSRGTDIIIPAYRAVSEDWVTGMIQSVLKNFWPAIHEGMLEVEIYDEDALQKVINADNLEVLLEENQGEETGNAYFYYLAKTSPDEDGYFNEHLEGLGDVDLYVKRGENYPKRVQQMRAPLMVVKPENYPRALLDAYAAVLICRDEEGNNFLKGLEPPQHNEWDETLGDDEKTIRNNKRVYRRLQAWVREKLKSLSKAYAGELAEIPGLAEYLTSMERDDNIPFGRRGKSNDEPKDESSVERVVLKSESAPAQRPLAFSHSAIKADTGPGEGGGGGGGSGGGNDGTAGTPKQDGAARSSQKSPVRVRNLGMAANGEFTDVELCLYSNEPFEGSIRLIAAGEDLSSGVRVLHAHSTNGVAYTIKSGRIQNVKVDANRPTIITAQMEGKNIRYALGVETHEINA
jgi:hypothetical protein